MFIVLWQLHIVLEINPNWIKLCYNTVSMVDEIKGFQDKKYEVYWFDGDHSRTGKHLDRLQGAGYPKIPPKKRSILFLLRLSACLFWFWLLAREESKTYIQRCQHQRLVPEIIMIDLI